MRIFLTIMFLMTVFFQTSLSAKDANIIGPGSSASCGKWLESRYDSAIHVQHIQWVQGFISGANWYTTGTQADPLDTDAVAAFMDAYCRNNPFHKLVLAAAALVQEAGGPKAFHQWKR